MQQSIDTYDFTGKKALVRVDFNVPLNEKFEITDDTRIRAAVPTLKKILEKGGSVIIMSHLGRPKGVTEKFSLKHILGRVEELLEVPVKFVVFQEREFFPGVSFSCCFLGIVLCLSFS